MRKLLEELQKTDPTCYEEIARGLEQVDIEYEEDIIQGCIQRACIGQKWPIIQSFDCDPDTPGAFLAEICSGEINGLLGRACAESPAKSILTAYLSAIRSQPCQS